MDEVPLERLAVGVAEERHRPVLVIALRRRPSGTIVLPDRPAEDVVAEGERVFEVVLLHDPRRAQAAAIDAVLDAELLEHHLLEHLRQRVAAGIGHVRRGLGDRAVVAIEEVADAGVAADQDELARGLALAELLEQPEQPLHRDVHHVVGRLLAGREMDDMGDAIHRRRDRRRDRRSSRDTTSMRSVSSRTTVVAEGADPRVAPRIIRRAGARSNCRPTLPVAPVTRISIHFLPAGS